MVRLIGVYPKISAAAYLRFNSKDGAIDSVTPPHTRPLDIGVSIPKMVRLIGFISFSRAGAW